MSTEAGTLHTTAGGATAGYNYDPFGRLDTVTSAGQIIEQYVYDGFDRTTTHRKRDASGLASTNYAYDPLDRTTTKTDKAGTPEAKTTDFAYLGLTDKVVAEEVAGQLDRTYQYDAYGRRLTQQKKDTDGSGPEVAEDSFYGYNPHTDVETLTTTTGDTKATYGYTAYGSNNKESFTGIDKPDAQNPGKEPFNYYRYTGKRFDPASGGYDMGFRDYQPGINRFTTRDLYNGALADMNLGTNPWTGNRYALAGGNPITGIEIDGHKIYLENFGSVSVSRANASDGEIQRASQRVAEDPEAAHVDSVPYEDVLEFMADEMKTNPESETADAIRAKFSPWCGYYLITASWNCEADGLTLWGNAVKTGGQWDHKGPLHDLLGVSDKNAILYTKIPGKDEKIRYDVWSNIHYGFVGMELGISRLTLQGGAAAADLMDNGHLNPEDSLSIQIGTDLSVKYDPEELTPEALNQAIMEHHDEFVQLGIIRPCSDNSEGVTVGC